MQAFANRVRAYLENKDLSESELADLAGVSQSTVSRAISGTISRRGRAFRVLFKFIQKNSTQATAKRRIAAAFDRVWNGTQGHAESIARVVESLEDFCPAKEEEL